MNAVNSVRLRVDLRGNRVLARCVRTLAIAAAIAFAVSAEVAVAADKPVAPDRVPLNLTAGETYVIQNLAKDAKPTIKVIDNPHALIVYGEVPGKLTLLGAERGRWVISIIDNSGRQVDYDVAVEGVANPGAPLSPGNSPHANSGEGAGARAAISPSLTPATGNAAARPASVSKSQEPNPAAAQAPRPSESPLDSFGFAPVAADRSPSRAGDETPIGKWKSNPAVAAYATPSLSGGPSAPNYLPGNGLVLMQGTSQVLDFARRLTRVSIADSKIADIQVISPYQINLVAHTPGFTTLTVWDDRGNYAERQVRVDTGGRQQVMLNCVVAELDRSRMENQGINLSMALTNYGVSMVAMPGAVASPYSATTQLQSSGSSSAGGILPPGGEIIPLLLSPNITYGLSAGNSNFQTQSFFQYLETHNLAKILAEPHLLANSGESAKFLSGGEIPIVVAQALNTSIVFKQFGTSVEFLPTVVGANTIELFVKPEVSQPNYAEGVSLFGFTVPAFVTRRAQTMVRLRDGQTLIIAGLILHNPVSTVNKVPYLGDVPYLGGLFRTTSHSTTETDLVMSVTPRIVAPLPPGAQVALPESARLSPESIKTEPVNPPDASRPRF